MKLTAIALAIAAFMRPAIVAPIPAGVTPDNTGDWGGFQFQQNMNRYSQSLSSEVTAGTAMTISTTDLLAGVIQLNAGASGGFTATLPTTAQIIAAFGATVPQDGTFSKIIRIVNNSVGQTATLTAGDTPTTVVGTATIATATCRDFVMRFLASSLTFTNIGSLTL